eukprot:Tbor_TRINITY_DN1791_c0_g1::TRINITY_DN1791_c0_g1_i1::g.21360::m.21360/K01476/E3.5.3.1, rocF, arg; arginase
MSMEDYSIPLDEIEVPRITPARVGKHSSPMKFIKTNEVNFILAKCSCGSQATGPEQSPELIIHDKFLDVIRGLEWKTVVTECIQVNVPNPTPMCSGINCYNPLSVAATSDEVYKAVCTAHEKGQFPMIVGGDHTVSLGSIQAAVKKYPNLRVLYFNAHADMNTPATSSSGDLHGMIVAGLLGLLKGVPGFENNRFQCLDSSRIAYCGLREVDDGESKAIKEYGIVDALFDMDELKRTGMTNLMDRLLAKINPNNEFPVHLSFDLCGMDPIDTPSTNSLSQNGVRIHEAVTMINILRATGCLVSMDCVGMNPLVGTSNDVAMTVANTRVVIANALANANSDK